MLDLCAPPDAAHIQLSSFSDYSTQDLCVIFITHATWADHVVIYDTIRYTVRDISHMIRHVIRRRTRNILKEDEFDHGLEAMRR
jgi:hypothetical protein